MATIHSGSTAPLSGAPRGDGAYGLILIGEGVRRRWRPRQHQGGGEDEKARMSTARAALRRAIRAAVAECRRHR